MKKILLLKVEKYISLPVLFTGILLFIVFIILWENFAPSLGQESHPYIAYAIKMILLFALGSTMGVYEKRRRSKDNKSHRHWGKKHGNKKNIFIGLHSWPAFWFTYFSSFSGTGFIQDWRYMEFLHAICPWVVRCASSRVHDWPSHKKETETEKQGVALIYIHLERYPECKCAKSRLHTRWQLSCI